MSTNTLGQSKRLGQYWSDRERHPAKEITLISVEEDHVPDLEAVEDYPFRDQKRTVGEFEYEMPSSNGFASSGSFEYRHDSGLFLISTEATVLKHEKVISKINQELSRDAKINEALSVDRRDLWELLDKAESVRPFRVSGPYGKYDLNDLQRVARHSKSPGEAVEELHRDGKIDDYESLKQIAEEVDIPKEAHSVTDLDIDLFEHRVIYAEAEFPYDGEYVTIAYNRGSIDIDADTDESKEYAIQLIERDLISAG